MKILIADDHALFREGMRYVLAQLAEQVAIMEAGNGVETLQALDAHQDIGLVLLDLGMPGGDGFSALERLSRQYPALPVVVLSASEQRLDMQRALDLGAMGFIPKSATAPVMLSALRLVLSGGIYVPTALARAHPCEPAAEPDPPSALTARQREVLGYVIEGKPNKIIAAELDLTEATVKAHITAVFKALKVRNRTQAALAATRLGLAAAKRKALA